MVVWGYRYPWGLMTGASPWVRIITVRYSSGWAEIKNHNLFILKKKMTLLSNARKEKSAVIYF